MAKKFRVDRLGRLIDGVVKWAGIIVLSMGIFYTCVCIYDSLNNTVDKRLEVCKKTLYSEQYVSDDKAIVRNANYQYCTEDASRMKNEVIWAAWNFVGMGGFILITRILFKKVVNYLWT